MDSAIPKLTLIEDSIPSSQEEILSENEFQLLQNKLRDEMGIVVEDYKPYELQCPANMDPYLRPQQITSPSPTCSLPCTEDWPGQYNIEIWASSVSSSKKTWLFSTCLNKLYSDIFKSIPLQFKINFPSEDEGLYIRALPVYTISQHMSYPVNRCPLHLREDENKGLNNINHVVRCEDQDAIYEFDEVSKRYSVIVPLGHPQPGCDVVTLMYSLACKSSCCGGMNRRPIMIIFTLEKNQQVLGRKTLNIRICSCPKRDKEKEEKGFHEENAGQELPGAQQLGASKKLMMPKDLELNGNTHPLKRRKLLFSSPKESHEDMKVYTIKICGTAHTHEVLRYLIMLKEAEHKENPSQKTLLALKEYEDMMDMVLKDVTP